MNGATIDFTRKGYKHARQRIHAEKAQVAILRGMSKEMPPTQAIVFMSYFNQFPERYVHANGDYFSPDWRTTVKQLGIRRSDFWKMTRALVELGFLYRRRHALPLFGRMVKVGPVEYRIDFDKLAKYEEDKKAIPGAGSAAEDDVSSTT